MCGNGIRCVGKYVYDKGLTDKTELTVDTLSGIRTLRLHVEGGIVRTATVGMGTATVDADRTLAVPTGPDGRRTQIVCTPVSVGNPHAVLFVDDAENAPVASLGPVLEHDPSFPGGVNVEFVQRITPAELRMRVWERGSGITMACGTGACASVAAAVSKGLCPAGEPVKVRLDGGTLRITVAADGTVTMEGPAETVYEGDTTL